MSFGNRIKQYIEYKGLNIRSFEKASNLKNGAIHRVIKNNTSLNGESIALIGKQWKELDLNWLITGDGQMLIRCMDDHPVDLVQPERRGYTCEDVLFRAEQQIRLQNELIKTLKDYIAKLDV